LIDNAIVSADVSEAEKQRGFRQPRSQSLLSLLLVGGATLGVAMGIERALGFVSNMLAARVGGPQVFGGYAVVLATAGTIAAYAGAGIGNTAIRFSGQHPRESNGYRKFVWAIALVSVGSAVIGSMAMLAGAGPLARFVLHNEALTSVLRVAAISSAAIILLDCCRGLLIGQQRPRSLLVLSVIFGIGLVIVLPLAARVGARSMILGQACVALVCVLVCLSFAKPLGLQPLQSQTISRGPGIAAVLKFGLFQLGAFAGVSAATWLVALMVARSDSSLTQMGLYAIANQFRGLASLAPVLCGQVGYSLLTDESASKFGGPERVMLTNSLLSTFLVVAAAGVAMIFAPWLVFLIYGKSFAGAQVPMLILLATGIIHMSGGPAMQRLSIVSLRALGVINAVWAIVTAATAVWLVPLWGATGAGVAFLSGHCLAQLLVALSLQRLRELPGGYASLMTSFAGGAVIMAMLGYWRTVSVNKYALTMALVTGWLVIMLAVWRISVRTGCLSQWGKSPLRLFVATETK